MEIVIFILVVIILFLVISIRNNLNTRITEVHERLNFLSDRISKIGIVEKPAKKDLDVAQPAASKQPTPQPLAPGKEPDGIPEIPQVKETVEPPLNSRIAEKIADEVALPLQRTPEPAPQPAKPGFLERNPDMEKFIGENLANKVGIAILVLGIGFFVKYAIDKEWIGVYGRVFIGILCGAILLGVAHKLRKSFGAFSSVLVGGGIAILYLTITIAFHEYNVIGQIPAFLIMIFITSFTIVLSVTYGRMELAILAILGGFGSPFMVSSGEGNYVVLFTYILVLDAGMVVLAYFKRWNPVNIIAYIFTIILFGSWLGVRFDASQGAMAAGAMTFATLFYILFFAMNIVNNLKERTRFNAIEITMLISNTFLYYAAGMYILNNPALDMFKGLFTAGIGVFNFVFAYTLYKSQRVDKNLVYLLIGLVLTFISLAAPVQLKGNHITMFWSAEAVLLLWLSQQSGIRLMKLASVIVMVLMIVSLAMDWANLYGNPNSEITLTIVLNKGFITSIFSLICIALTTRLLRFETMENKAVVKGYHMILTLVGILALYLGVFLELRHQLEFFLTETTTIAIIIGSYNMLFIFILTSLERRMVIPAKLRTIFPLFGILALLLYLGAYHKQVIEARDLYIAGTQSFVGFAFHYLLIALLVAVAIWSLRRIRALKEFNEQSFNLYSWIFVFFFLFIASSELDHTVVLSVNSGIDSVQHIVQQNHKIGFPILWGLASFLLIAIGLRKKRRHLRIISLSLFLITLLKLFLIDIRGISEGGMIAAFISLGVLLLVVSFMYQRLKKFLLEDDDKETSNTEA